MDEGTTPEERLAALRVRHRELDDEIATLTATAGANALRIQALKKQKLILKDAITRLESDRIPDIIA